MGRPDFRRRKTKDVGFFLFQDGSYRRPKSSPHKNQSNLWRNPVEYKTVRLSVPTSPFIFLWVKIVRQLHLRFFLYDNLKFFSVSESFSLRCPIRQSSLFQVPFDIGFATCECFQPGFGLFVMKFSCEAGQVGLLQLQVVKGYNNNQQIYKSNALYAQNFYISKNFNGPSLNTREFCTARCTIMKNYEKRTANKKIEIFFSKSLTVAEMRPIFDSANHAELQPIFIHWAEEYLTLIHWSELLS